MIQDELQTFNPAKNPAYAYVETVCFLAKSEGKIVGRIAGLINHKLNALYKTKEVRFTRFDVIDSLEVSTLLLDKVSEWGKEHGMDTIIGPIGFSNLDKQGMLIEGFEEPGMFITLYNHPYYVEHMRKLNFEKAIDWIEYKIKTPETLNPKIARITELVMKRNNYTLKTFTSKKSVIPYMKKAFTMYNEAFTTIYGFCPLDEAQVERTIRQFISLVSLDYLFIVTDAQDEVLGFGLMVPSLAEAVRSSKGRLLPTGIFKIKQALKHPKVLDMYLIAVKPEYTGRGINAIILEAGIQKAIANGIAYAETGPELEDNVLVQSQWKNFDTQQHKRRRCFKKTL